MTKKIAFVLESFGTGGVSEVVKHIFEALENKKYQIELILLTNKKVEFRLPFVNYSYFKIAEDHDYSLTRYVQYALFKSITQKKYQAVIKYINNLNPDIIHFHTNPRQLVFSHLLKKNLRDKILFTDHSVRLNSQNSTWVKTKLLSYVYKHYYKYLNITAVSTTVYKNHNQFNLVSNNKRHHLIENKIKPIARISHPISANDNTIRFIYVARIHPNKGHDVLIKAWSNVNSKVVRELVLIGPNSMGLNTKDSSIKILGSLPKSKVDAWLQKSNFGVFPSKKEGLPLALIEMLSASLPVIVNDIPELTDIVTDGHNGLIYQQNNVEDLSNKIEIILNNEKNNIQLSRNAKISSKKYAVNKPGVEYFQLYQSLILYNS